MSLKGQHHCARCGTHRGRMVVNRKKSGLFNGRPFNLCEKCDGEYKAKRQRKEGK